MVDQAIFIDEVSDEKIDPEHQKLIDREKRLFRAAVTKERNKDRKKKTP